jgi:hypothetical protein
MGCADVCIDMDYGEDNEFYAESFPLARKEHRCCECRRTIKPGERYQRCAGKSDGSFWAERSCAECCEVRKAFVCGTWIFGQLWECIEEELFPVWRQHSPIDCLAKLTTPAAVALCRERFAEWQDEHPARQRPQETP